MPVNSTFLLAAFAAVLCLPAFAQEIMPAPDAQPISAVSSSISADAPRTTSEADRLMQAYMLKRAERIALRTAAREKLKTAKDAAEKKKLHDDLDLADAPLRQQASDLARQYRTARQQRQQIELPAESRAAKP